MPLRGCGKVILTGTAQPLFGTTTTAAINPTPDRYTGQFDPRSQASTGTVTVTTIQYFRVGDHCQLGPAGGPYDSCKITSITVGSSPAGTIGLQGLTKSHASGEWLILSKACAQITITPDVTTAVIYIGEDNTVGAASLTLIAQFPTAAAASTAVYQIGSPSTGNVVDTPNIWLLGTSGDAIIPSILTI